MKSHVKQKDQENAKAIVLKLASTFPNCPTPLTLVPRRSRIPGLAIASPVDQLGLPVHSNNSMGREP